MSRLPLDSGDGGGRYPGFSTLAQSGHWDRATAGVVLGRLAPPADIRFFTPAEEATARALFDQLLDQHAEPRVPVVNFVDARLAENQTDGWRFEDMPEDRQAWHESLSALDRAAEEAFNQTFANCNDDRQSHLLRIVRDLGASSWQGLPAGRRRAGCGPATRAQPFTHIRGRGTKSDSADPRSLADTKIWDSTGWNRSKWPIPDPRRTPCRWIVEPGGEPRAECPEPQ